MSKEQRVVQKPWVALTDGNDTFRAVQRIACGFMKGILCEVPSLVDRVFSYFTE